jgi:hypothetical protein
MGKCQWYRDPHPLKFSTATSNFINAVKRQRNLIQATLSMPLNDRGISRLQATLSMPLNDRGISDYYYL